MDSDHDIKTRVTTLDELKVKQRGDDCLVVIYAPDQSELGKRHLLDKDVMRLGRDRDNDIVLNSDSVSRRHARVEHRDGERFLVDLDSTNGTFLNDDTNPVTHTQLRRGDQIKIGDTIFRYLSGSDVEAQYHETIFNMTIKDGLTDLSNKRQLDTVLGKEISRAQRHERPLSLLMVDIDHFKDVNDTYGHIAGDSVLKELAVILQGRLRPDDEVGRYGGEEFAVILPETPLMGAVRIGDELRKLVEEHKFTAEGEPISITISVGAAVLERGSDAKTLYKAADEQLYEAKRTGRNRVCPPQDEN